MFDGEEDEPADCCDNAAIVAVSSDVRLASGDDEFDCSGDDSAESDALWLGS
jgi:hypothetical protein